MRERPIPLAHPQIHHRRTLLERGSYRGAGIPVKLDRTPGGLRHVPPPLGERGREILREAGFSGAGIEPPEAGAIVEPQP